jgi:hypothetical protein
MSTPETLFRGGCMCRAIRYEIAAKPMLGAHCQCLDCQHERFCPSCGAPVMGATSGLPDVTTISAGSLDDPSVFKPQFVCCTSRGHAWDLVDPALPSFPRMPSPGGPQAPAQQPG